jgi:hypothetical protein
MLSYWGRRLLRAKRIGYPTLTKSQVKLFDVLLSVVFLTPLVGWILVRLISALFDDPGLFLTSVWFWLVLIVVLVILGVLT